MLIAIRKILFAVAFASVFAASAAAQQQPPQPPAAQPPVSTPPAKPECSNNQLGGPSNGVICPPDVDPGMKIPPPETGAKMPVIPPPGAPGGDQKIQPK
jgi:hypothetical protein